MSTREKLIQKIKALALIRDAVVLASGLESLYYVDLSKIAANSTALLLACEELNNKFKWDNVNLLGGPAIGALPFIAGIQIIRENQEYFTRGFFTRNKQKDHGKKELIEGSYIVPGELANILEDVTTSGKSLLNCVKLAQSQGAIINNVLSIVDRNQGARELFKEHKIPFNYLISIEEIVNNE